MIETCTALVIPYIPPATSTTRESMVLIPPSNMKMRWALVSRAFLLSVVCSLASLSANGQTRIQLEYQGHHRFLDVYWESRGIKAAWTPRYTEIDGLFQNRLSRDLGYITISVTDHSNLANENQIVLLEKKPTLKSGLRGPRISPLTRMADSSSIRLEAEPYLLDGNEISVYVYGLRKVEASDTGGRVRSQLLTSLGAYDEYEEYLHDIIHVYVGYEDEAKNWEENRWQSEMERLTENNRERAIELGTILVIVLAGLSALWFLRHKIAAAFRWLINLPRKLRKIGVKKMAGSPELEVLKEKIRIAIANGDIEEAERYTALASQVKKIKL